MVFFKTGVLNIFPKITGNNRDVISTYINVESILSVCWVR